jgi:hypothetical protein
MKQVREDNERETSWQTPGPNFKKTIKITLKHTTLPLRPSELISSPPRLSEPKLSLIKKHSVLERREKPSDVMVQTSVLSFYLYEKGKY